MAVSHRIGIAAFRRDPESLAFSVTASNAAADELLGLSLQQQKGVWPPGPLADALSIAATLEPNTSVEFTSIDEGAQDPPRLHVSVLCPAPGELTLVLSDIPSLLPKMEEALATSRKQQEQLLYSVSHDLKAPIRAITMAAEWLESDSGGNLPREARQDLQLITSRVRWLSGMLEAILQLSRVARLAVAEETFDLGVPVSALVEELRPSYAHTFVVADAWPTVRGDASMVQRALSCLVDNAARHNDQPTGHVELGWIEVPNGYRVFVRDDGPGIPPQHRERVFELFTKLQRRDEVDTTGAGLTLCRALARRWGGDIEVAAHHPRGSEFSFTLPAA